MSDIVERMARAGFAWQVARSGLKLAWDDALAAPLHYFWRRLGVHCLAGCATGPLARFAGYTPEEYAARALLMAVAADDDSNIKPGFLSWEQLPEHCRQYFRELSTAMNAGDDEGYDPARDWPQETGSFAERDARAHHERNP